MTGAQLQQWFSDGVRAVRIFVLAHPHEVGYVIGGLALLSAALTLRAIHRKGHPERSEASAFRRREDPVKARRTPAKAALVQKLVAEGLPRTEIARKTRLPYDAVAMLCLADAHQVAPQ